MCYVFRGGWAKYLSLALDEDGKVLSILTIPGREGREELKTVGGRGDSDGDRCAVLRGSLVSVLAGVVAVGRKSETSRLLELELGTIRRGQFVFERVKVQASCDGHGHDKVGRGDEGVGGGVGVITSSKVAVVRRDDRVGLALLYIFSVPLTWQRC
jgi:hypothetical protein